MKVRNGFVSNSSSSSFVVLLPEDFLENVDYEKIVDGNEDFPLDEFKRLLNDFVEEGGMWLEEIYNEYENDDFDFTELLDTLVTPYMIASMEGGPDEGQIVVADRELIKKLL